MATTFATDTRATVVAAFRDRDRAKDAIAALRRDGFRDDQIGLLGPYDRSTEKKSGLANDPTDTRWEEGAGIGAASGAALGLGLGAAVMAGLLGPLGVVAGGPLVALLASAGAGATAGTVVGGLIGLGVPEDEAKWYESEVTSGRTLVTVHNADNRIDEARRVLLDHGGTMRTGANDVGTYGSGLPATPY
ncbi:MAG TPA: hypothetical protein VM597_25480 [Gemmataceae bacterium]|nr:hypothetical protein [Gemmataceae bacterium]